MIKKNLLDTLDKMSAFFPDLEKADLIKIDKKTERIIGKMKAKPEALKYFHPIKIKKPFVQQLVASLLLTNLQDLKKLVLLKTTPALWIMLIKIIVRAIEREDLESLRFLLKYSYGETEDALGSVKQSSVVILPDIEKYNEKDVIQKQRDLQNIKLSDYENKK